MPLLVAAWMGHGDAASDGQTAAKGRGVPLARVNERKGPVELGPWIPPGVARQGLETCVVSMLRPDL